MNSQQLKAEIEATQKQLKKLQEQLEASKSVTIETAQPGDTLPDGCVVIARYDDSILIAAPSTTEVECKWTPEFPEVFESLKDHGFIPAQWYIPSVKELELAYRNYKEQFSSTFYRSSTEYSSTSAFFLYFNNANTLNCNKTYCNCVRAFRRVVL
jgi:hypothetical protein